MSSGITVVVTTVAPRRAMLREAIRSIADQTLPPDMIVVQDDERREGAPINRERGTNKVTTGLVAYLDDDDRFLPHHLEVLAAELERTGADLVYPWFTVEGGTDPFPMFFDQPWDNAAPHQIPVTFLARVDAIRAAEGWAAGWDPEMAEDPGTDEYGNRAGEDWMLTLRLVANDAKIVHLPDRSWIWRHWLGGAGLGNSSGLPSRVPWGIA